MKKIYVLIIFIGVFTIVFSTPVIAQSSLNITDQEEEIQIFPNPISGDVLNVKSTSGKSITCRVFNVLGKTVLYKVITSEKLDISALPQGVYVLRMKIGNVTNLQKLVRQ